MSLLLALASMAIASAAWSGVVQDCKKASANSRVKNEKYNLHKHFEDVLRCSNVRRKKQDGHKYLPAGGWEQCIPYIKRQPYTTDKDIKEFINHYEKVRQKELSKINNHWEYEYEKVRKEYLSSPRPTKEFIFEKNFYAFFDEQFVKELADELYEKTFMGDMAVQRPKVVEIPATNEAYAMIWVIRCYGGKLKAKKYFRACCRYLEKPID